MNKNILKDWAKNEIPLARELNVSDEENKKDDHLTIDETYDDVIEFINAVESFYGIDDYYFRNEGVDQNE